MKISLKLIIDRFDLSHRRRNSVRYDDQEQRCSINSIVLLLVYPSNWIVIENSFNVDLFEVLGFCWLFDKFSIPEETKQVQHIRVEIKLTFERVDFSVA